MRRLAHVKRDYSSFLCFVPPYRSTVNAFIHFAFKFLLAVLHLTVRSVHVAINSCEHYFVSVFVTGIVEVHTGDEKRQFQVILSNQLKHCSSHV